MSDLELRVENLNVGFGRRTVLRDISFTVHAGEFICLLGQNAAGKTTLFKAVSNLIASSCRRIRGRAAGSYCAGTNAGY